MNCVLLAVDTGCSKVYHTEGFASKERSCIVMGNTTDRKHITNIYD